MCQKDADTKKPGAIPLPVEMFDTMLRNLPTLNLPDVMIIILVMRLNYCRQKDFSGISLNQLAEFTHLSRSCIGRSLNKLIGLKVMKVFASNMGTKAKVIGINQNYREWRLMTKALVSRHEEHLVSHKEGRLVSQQKEHYKEKEKESIKEKEKEIYSSKNSSGCSSINTTTAASASKGNQITGSAQAGDPDMNQIVSIKPASEFKNDIDRNIRSLFISCLGFNPNLYQMDALKGEIYRDDRLEADEIIRIVQESFHKAAICDENKRNTKYVIGIIKSMKQELFEKKEKKKKEEEKLRKLEDEKRRREENEYEPGTFMNMYFESMKKGKGS